MEKPIVLLDCDGPLSDFHNAAMRWLRHVYPDLHRWKPDKPGAIQNSLPPDRADALNHACANDPEFCRNLDVVPGARHAVHEMRKHAEVYVLTAPFKNSPTWAFERINWLHKHFGFTSDHIISTPAKYLVRGDVFVEDKVSALQRWQAAWPNSRGLLWYADWNAEHHFAHPGAAAWEEMLPLVLASISTADMVNPCAPAEKLSRLERPDQAWTMAGCYFDNERRRILALKRVFTTPQDLQEHARPFADKYGHDALAYALEWLRK